MLCGATVFILKLASILVVDGGVKGSPFRSRHREEKKNNSGGLTSAWLSGLHQTFIKPKLGRQGSRGLMGIQQERRWPPFQR